MTKILVAYASMAGSTEEVAQTIGDELARHGVQVEVLPVDEVDDVKAYDGVVIGGPMIWGWHRAAGAFLKQNRAALRRIPLAVFATAMSLTQPEVTRVGGVRVHLDDKLPKAPARPGHLTVRERYAQLAHYVQPILAAAGPAKPTSIGLFGGRMEYGRLPWWAVLFAMFIIQAPAGDHRNWLSIRAWAAKLPAEFGLASPQARQQAVAV
ncbi:MAG: flavodoxin domain-containing protein [Anaerolineales bacterium]